MDARRESEPTPMKNHTTVERKSERELVVARTFNGPARIVFEAWTKPELLKRWWAPKSTGVSLLSCEVDVRVGGRYRFEFGHEASKPMAFFGRYIEVTPHSRLIWTNDESDDGAVDRPRRMRTSEQNVVTEAGIEPAARALKVHLGTVRPCPPGAFP
jgi:uncharacterized protein YndB with AHSA1/START domain